MGSLTSGVYQTSSTFRVSVQVKDSQGAITTASRTVQLVPYDHAPTLTAKVVQGSKAGDTFVVQPTFVDADQGTTWDPHYWVRADMDNDGVYETDWQSCDSGTPTFVQRYGSSGTYTANLQVRDSFQALGNTHLKIVVK